MTSVYLDPYILAYPSKNDNNVTVNDFENYIENILSWRDLKDVTWSDVLTSKNATDILMELNNYPHWEDLKSSLAYTGLNQFYQPKDIIEVVDGFLRLKTIEEHLDVKDVLIDNVTTSIDPVIVIRSTKYSEEYKRLLMLNLLSLHLSPSNENTFLVSRDIGNINIDITGEIHDCEFHSNTIMLSYPLTLKGLCKSCASIRDLILNIDSSKVWERARRFGRFTDAIYIDVYQRICAMGEDPDSMPEWTIGKEFIETCNDQGFLNDETKIRALLRTCTDTILGVDHSATHALRTGTGGDNPQRKRGNDKAWRRDIGYEYHLHYWETSKGPEFASVVVHNNMSIPA